MSKSETSGKILTMFLSVQTHIKIYHFQTKSYARHKTVDQFYNDLTDLLDKFMEVLQGAWNVRVKMNDSIKLININDKHVIYMLSGFRTWLKTTLPKLLDLVSSSTDLLNIRDEILEKVNQTLYLLTFV